MVYIYYAIYIYIVCVWVCMCVYIYIYNSKEIKPVNLKGNQPWIFIGRTDAEAEATVFWSSDVNRLLLAKVPNVGKDWGPKEKRVSEDEMAGWYHRCNEHELGQTLGNGEGQGGFQSMGLQRVRHDLVTEQQRQWSPGIILIENTGVLHD